jgi:nucleoid-associated protein YgaU
MPSRKVAPTGKQAGRPTPTAPSLARAGQSYIVQTGDYLRKLALRFYGDEAEWPVIWNGTNAMAEKDDSFAVIRDPNLIQPGWKLWIPAK